MSTLNTTTINVSNTLSTGILYANNVEIFGDDLNYGNLSINSTAVSVNSTSLIANGLISVPSISIGGTIFSGPIPYGGIVNTQFFSANGTWTNPYLDTSNPIQQYLTGDEQVFVMMWGGGGGGGSATYNICGGGGGFNMGWFKSNELTLTETVIVGIGNSAGAGSFSSFNGIFAYGGGGSTGGSFYAGGGGGMFSVGGTTAGGGDPLGGATGALGGDAIYGGGGGGSAAAFGSANGGVSVFGGGGGGSGTSGRGAISIYGGAGGTVTGAVAVSIFGGVGANSSTPPAIPGGGGSHKKYTTGANGEVLIWVIR